MIRGPGVFEDSRERQWRSERRLPRNAKRTEREREMFAPMGPRGGPRPPPLAPAIPEPDLSHLTEEERKIIMAVLARQREEEAREEAMLK